MTITYLLNVLLMLVLVAGMAIGAIWLTRKLQPGLRIGQRTRAVKLIDALPMGAVGRLAVVEFEGKRLLVAVSRGRIELLAQAPVPPEYIDDGE